MRPRRTCLTVPASSARKLEKALTAGADEIVVDLEDGVVGPLKDRARAELVVWLAKREPDTNVSVRVNAPRTPWCHLDVIAMAMAPMPPTSLVLPKVESPGDLEFLDRLLDGVEEDTKTPRSLRVQALIETARGLSRIDDIVRASRRLDAVILGYADLGASLGRPHAAIDLPQLWIHSQETLLLAARAADLQAIDGPFLTIDDEPALRAAANHTALFGFDGKWAIHPVQVATINAAFTPSDQDVQRARSVLTALANAEQERHEGAVQLDGKMVDEAVRKAALRVLARASVR
jgi:citrate lyase subunit beta / citryl-CoA lyase